MISGSPTIVYILGLPRVRIRQEGTLRKVDDEIHTPDSSRYFYVDGYEDRQAKGEAQKQLSKEFVRQWLIENGFQGLEGQTMPLMPDEFVDVVTNRYVELFEKITGRSFERADTSDIQQRIQDNVNAYLEGVEA